MKHEVAKGRGATLQIEGRFEQATRERFDDGWNTVDEELPPFHTTVTVERAKTVLQRQNSPDLPFDYSLNAYRGCEHGCIYCYARPSHGYLNLSPGIDFETRLFAKPDAAQLLRAELAKPFIAVRRSRSAPTPILTSRSNVNGGSRARSSRCWPSANTRCRS